MPSAPRPVEHTANVSLSRMCVQPPYGCVYHSLGCVRQHHAKPIRQPPPPVLPPILGLGFGDWGRVWTVGGGVIIAPVAAPMSSALWRPVERTASYATKHNQHDCLSIDLTKSKLNFRRNLESLFESKKISTCQLAYLNVRTHDANRLRSG